MALAVADRRTSTNPIAPITTTATSPVAAKRANSRVNEESRVRLAGEGSRVRLAGEGSHVRFGAESSCVRSRRRRARAHRPIPLEFAIVVIGPTLNSTSEGS
jgi:hypothetical protein